MFKQPLWFGILSGFRLCWFSSSFATFWIFHLSWRTVFPLLLTRDFSFDMVFACICSMGMSIFDDVSSGNLERQPAILNILNDIYLQRFAPLENRDDFVVVVLLFGFSSSSSSSSCPTVVVVFIFCSPSDASKPPLPQKRRCGL